MSDSNIIDTYMKIYILPSKSFQSSSSSNDKTIRVEGLGQPQISIGRHRTLPNSKQTSDKVYTKLKLEVESKVKTRVGQFLGMTSPSGQQSQARGPSVCCEA